MSLIKYIVTVILVVATIVACYVVLQQGIIDPEGGVIEVPYQ